MTHTRVLARLGAMAALGAVLGAATLVVLTARASIRIAFDTDPPRLVSGVFPAERDEGTGLTFAWTGRDMAVRLPGLDRSREWTLTLRARAARADSATAPVLSFYADGVQVGTHQTTNAFETIRVAVPPRPQRPRGAVLRIDVSTTVVPGAGDPRALGVMLDELTIAPVGRVLPPPRAVGGAAVGMAAFAAAIALMTSAGAGAGAVLAVSVGQAAMLSRGFAPYTNYPGAAARLAAAIALGVVLLAAWTRRGGARPSAAARFVIIFSAAAMFLKLLVLLHPQMPIGDAMFHAHRFQGVLTGNLYFTSLAPGNYTFPYPPAFYLLAAAFSGLVTRGTADMDLLRVVGMTVDALAGAALYVAVRQSWNAAWTGAAAVVLYHMMPLSFRIFTVGNLTNAFAQSVAVFALAVVAAAPVSRFRAAYVVLLTCIFALAFMSHTSTFALLFCTGVSVAVLFRWRGDAASRESSAAVAMAVLLALSLAVVVYYGHFGETYRAELSRITAETVAAAPDAGGRGLAARARSVPMYLRSYLGLGALILAAAGGWGLYRRGGRDRLTLALAGWGLTCLLFLALGVLTPVDMRYYLASLPAVALAGAAGTSMLWARPTAGRVVAVALVAAVCWGGVVTWYTTF